MTVSWFIYVKVIATDLDKVNIDQVYILRMSICSLLTLLNDNDSD